MPKLSKVELYLLFKSSRKTGIFVCSSRYETLGLTPLEAALSGVTTVVSDGSQPVELVRFFPAEHRFNPNAEALADRVEGIWRKDLETCGKELRRHIKKDIPEGAFETEFLEAWRKVSTLSRAACQRDECVLLGKCAYGCTGVDI
jgi:glycosyltransferase involved in cell wall biosynthesis